MSGTFDEKPWQLPAPVPTMPPPQEKVALFAASADAAPFAQFVVSWSVTLGGLVGGSGHDVAGVPARVHEHGLAVPELLGVEVVGR